MPRRNPMTATFKTPGHLRSGRAAICFTETFILKWMLVPGAKLELARGTIKLIMLDGNAVVDTQRPNPGDIQANAQAPVAVIISAEAPGPGAHGTGVNESRQAQAHSAGLFNNRQAVFKGGIPETVAA